MRATKEWCDWSFEVDPINWSILRFLLNWSTEAGVWGCWWVWCVGFLVGVVEIV